MIKSMLVLGLGALLLASWPMTSGPRVAQPVAPEPAAETIPDSAVQGRAGGPVHEAFSGPWIGGQPRPPPIVAKEPPAAMEESPPEPPQGDNVQWIGGYWAWDVDRHSFLWISGVWRDLPTGRQWVPGHWNRLSDGWQRVPGFWMQYADSGRPPPASVDAGPTTPVPADDRTHQSRWTPSCRWQIASPSGQFVNVSQA